MPTASRARSGPFLIPARLLLLLFGLLTVGLAVFNVLHEFHAAEVDQTYLIGALVACAVWLAAIVVGFFGYRIAIFIAAALAFVQFGVLDSSHFVSSAAALSTFVKHEGLALATVDMALIPCCLMVVFGAAVAWTNPRGRYRRLDVVPLVVASLAGAVLVILQATDALHRSDLGSGTPEDGAFAAAVFASLWLAGGLWISSRRRTGALMIVVAGFAVAYSFVTLHLVPGGTTVAQIAAASGTGWAALAAATAVLAAASLFVALGILAGTVIRRRRPTPDEIGVRRRRA